MRYSKSTGLFYDPALHEGAIPADAVDISRDEFQALLTHRSNGGTIGDGPGGKPIALPAPARTLATAKAEKLAALAAKRYEVETGGVTVAGVAVKTDRESQATLTGAWVRLQRNPAISIQWKGATGWVTVGAAEIEAMADAVGDHVQACFGREKVHADAINSLTTIAKVDAYDVATGWSA